MGISLLTGALVLLPALSASAAPSIIVNGDFEAGAVGSGPIPGWTALNEAIDLGATTIAGCVTQDTSSYSDLREYELEADGTLGPVTVDSMGVVLNADDGLPVWVDSTGSRAEPNSTGAWAVKYGEFSDYDSQLQVGFYVTDESINYGASDTWMLVDDESDVIEDFIDLVEASFSTFPDPSLRADNTSLEELDEYEYETAVTDIVYDAESGEDVLIDSQVLRLSSVLDADDADGYVSHGPAVYSDIFSVTGPRSISLDWMAAAVEDDYHVLGYLLNVNTCAQTEIIDSTGLAQDWTTASVNLTTPGDYRFVFVSGTYDQSWGGAAGAVLYIDDIRSTAVIAGTGLDLALDLDLGAPVADATVQLSGGGLVPGSEWVAVLRSTPVTIATGVTDAQGNFFQLAQLPADVAPGQHSITLTGTAPDGRILSDVAFITVGADGTLTYLSFDAAEGTVTASGTTPKNQLADTGLDLSPVYPAAALLLLGAALSVVHMRRRRDADA